MRLTVVCFVTPKGASGAYYDVMHRRTSEIILNWTEHPDRGVGYTQ